jgi:hypothetical protein
MLLRSTCPRWRVFATAEVARREAIAIVDIRVFMEVSFGNDVRESA